MIQGKVAAGFALCAVAASPAFAQETRKLDFGLRADVEHNTNVARASEEQATLRGLARADTVFTPSATVDLVFPVGRQAVFLSGAAGYSFYDKNAQLDRERLDLTGGARGGFGPCAITVTGGYARGVNEVDDPVLVENVENIQETKRTSLDVTCARETGFGVVAGASKYWVSNDQRLAEESDSERTSFMVGMSYQRPALGAVTIFARHDQTDYPNRLIDEGYDLDSIGLTYDRQLGARIQGSVTVAYTAIDSHAPFGFSDRSNETTTYSANLSYRASSRLRFAAMFDRTVTPSSSFGGAYDLADAYRITGDYDLGSRLSVQLGASWVDREAEGGLSLPVIRLTESKTTTLFGSVRYKQSDRLSFVLIAGREERTTNSSLFDYTNNRVAFSADVAF